MLSILKLVFSRIHLGNFLGYLHESPAKNPWHIFPGMSCFFFVEILKLGWISVGPKSFGMRIHIKCQVINKQRVFHDIIPSICCNLREMLISPRNPHNFGTWCCGSTKPHFTYIKFIIHFYEHAKLSLPEKSLTESPERPYIFWKEKAYFFLRMNTHILGYLVLKEHLSCYQSIS